jgi:hypothetical protein
MASSQQPADNPAAAGLSRYSPGIDAGQSPFVRLFTAADFNDPAGDGGDAFVPLQSAHERAFHRWLLMSREDQVQGFNGFLATRHGALGSWLERATYGTLVPASAACPLRRLFFCHLDILLAIHRHRCGGPAAGGWRLDRMLDLAHQGDGSVQIGIKPLPYGATAWRYRGRALPLLYF